MAEILSNEVFCNEWHVGRLVQAFLEGLLADLFDDLSEGDISIFGDIFVDFVG